MSEVVPGLQRLVAPLGDRYVCVFIVVGSASAAVIDTGVAGTPAFVLEPALAALEVTTSHIVVTHADVDHSGGLAGARALAPQALAVCHPLDRPLVDSVDRLIDDRYREFRHDHEIDQSAEFCDWVRANDDVYRVFGTEELAPGEVIVAATGVSNGDLLRGVRFYADIKIGCMMRNAIFQVLMMGLLVTGCIRQNHQLKDQIQNSDSAAINYFKGDGTMDTVAVFKIVKNKDVLNQLTNLVAERVIKGKSNCGVDGSLHFFKNNMVVQDVYFQLNNDDCRQFIFSIDRVQQAGELSLAAKQLLLQLKQ